MGDALLVVLSGLRPWNRRQIRARMLTAPLDALIARRMISIALQFALTVSVKAFRINRMETHLATRIAAELGTSSPLLVQGVVIPDSRRAVV